MRDIKKYAFYKHVSQYETQQFRIIAHGKTVGHGVDLKIDGIKFELRPYFQKHSWEQFSPISISFEGRVKFVQPKDVVMFLARVVNCAESNNLHYVCFDNKGNWKYYKNN